MIQFSAAFRRLNSQQVVLSAELCAVDCRAAMHLRAHLYAVR